MAKQNCLFSGRQSIIDFLSRKWEKEKIIGSKKELWTFPENRISVRFEYEWRDADTCQWYRTHGNEHWEFDEDGLVSFRDMSGNDVPILESQRLLGRN